MVEFPTDPANAFFPFLPPFFPVEQTFYGGEVMTEGQKGKSPQLCYGLMCVTGRPLSVPLLETF